MRFIGLAALCAAGLLVAGVAADVVGAQTADITTTTTVTQPTTETTTVEETTTVQETTASPATTVVTTTTVATTAPTTTSSNESSGTETWVWIALALLGAAVIALAAMLLTRRNTALPEGERRRRLQGAIDSWAAQGWALTSETTDIAVMQRGGEHMMLTVDPAGQVVTRPATAQPPRAPSQPPPPPPQGRPPEDQPTREMRPEDQWPGDS